MYVTRASNVLYKFMKLIKKKIRESARRAQIYRGEICGSGVIINPLREQAAVYVAFYVYKIVRITEKRREDGGGGGYGSAGTMRASSRKERKSSEKAE